MTELRMEKLEKPETKEKDHKLKQRLTSVDLRYIVKELQTFCVGHRLANIYDLAPRLYLLKFARPESKQHVVVESGVRLHLTEFNRAKPALPSAFTLKLRKHLRTWRLEDVRQLGIDRVVVFTFGQGELAHHLIFEFFAKGNVILTNHEWEILSLLRTHKQDDGAKFAVRERYPAAAAVEFQPMTEARLLGMLQPADGGQVTLKQTLNTQTEYGPALIDHAIGVAQLKPNAKLKGDFAAQNADGIGRLLEALRQVDDWIVNCADLPHRGFLLKLKGIAVPVVAPLPGATGGEESGAAVVPELIVPYRDFSPLMLHQYADPRCEVVEFPSFNEAVDAFFVAFESMKVEGQQDQQEKQKVSKVDKVKKENEARIAALQQAQTLAVEKAALIQENSDEVEQAIAVIRSAMDQGVDWTELKRVVKEQQQQGNPIAHIIHHLHLEKNQVTLLLSHPFGDDASEEQMTSSVIPVDVDVTLSAYANAREYYSNKKKSAVKEEKTKAASTLALKSAERTAEKEAKKAHAATGRRAPQTAGGAPAAIKPLRKPLWFEKFHWFITSENYLVISGRDAQQNELLVKRYLRPGDLYVHADLHGASSCVIKNPSGQTVPPTSLAQAGTMTVCRSSAWDNKVVTSAWWVYHNQVSKTAPSGEYLPTGSFMIRGRKNFLPPNPLVMGFGVIFRVLEEDVPKHVHERRPRLVADDVSSVHSFDTAREGTVGVAEEEDGHEEEDGAEFSRDVSVDVTADSQSVVDASSEATPKGRDDTSSTSERVREHSDSSGEAVTEETLMQHTRAEDALVRQGSITSFLSHSQQERDPNVNTNFARYDLSQNDYDATLDRAAKSGASSGSDHQSPQNTRRQKQTAKERRMQKKQSVDDNNQDVESQQAQITQEKPQAKPAPPPARKVKKGGKGRRYGSDDEEERTIRSAMLGKGDLQTALLEIQTKKRQQEKAVEEIAVAPEIQALAKGDSGTPSPLSRSDEEGRTFSGKQPESRGGLRRHKSPQKRDKSVNFADSNGPERVPPTKSGESLGDPDEVHARRQVLEDEGEVVLNEDEKRELEVNDLDLFTGQPVASDTILFALPVCGPYSAMQQYKYRIKLTPGPQKRGKAIQLALHHFTGLKEASDRERDAVRGMDQAEMTAAILGSVKLILPAGSGKERKGK
eukprot:TRINITY_DN794_c0_g1_i1.p1 TRINITY_DN794_c0_g1~~TRINITY_DN794_c0_g1_i1.p1  ORF type:complete len:1158 (-),score=237.40 TRINITY_DN794_c0_g1_i1:1156-4629(-)